MRRADSKFGKAVTSEKEGKEGTGMVFLLFCTTLFLKNKDLKIMLAC